MCSDVNVFVNVCNVEIFLILQTYKNTYLYVCVFMYLFVDRNNLKYDITYLIIYVHRLCR